MVNTYIGEQPAKAHGSLKVLEIGCGQVRRVPGSTTLDVNPRSKADVIHDLNQAPYPFEDDTFDSVVAEHVLEHLDDVVKVMEELHRITKPGGIVYVEVPHFSSSNFFTDPTHRHAFSTRSFDYFVPGTELNSYRYSLATFKKRRAELSFTTGRLLPKWLANKFRNRAETYERRFAFIFPAIHINFELEVVK